MSDRSDARAGEIGLETRHRPSPFVTRLRAIIFRAGEARATYSHMAQMPKGCTSAIGNFIDEARIASVITYRGLAQSVIVVFSDIVKKSKR